MTWLLAIDPATYQTGAAVFKGEALVDYRLLKAPERAPVDQRIADLIKQLDQLSQAYPQITQAACEKTTGIDKHRPAPELQVMVRRTKSWATGRPRRYSWFEYHPSTVRAAVQLRGMGRDATAKDLLAIGVEALYGISEVEQDVIDAVAVGHCHILKTRDIPEMTT